MISPAEKSLKASLEVKVNIKVLSAEVEPLNMLLEPLEAVIVIVGTVVS